MPLRTWVIAFLAALALHIAVALALATRPDLSTGYAANLGESGLEIGLGAAGTYANIAEQTAVEDPVEPEAVEESKPKPESEPEPKPKPKPKPESKPVPKPEPVSKPEPVAKPAPEVRSVVKPKPAVDDVMVAKQEPSVTPTPSSDEPKPAEQVVEQHEPRAEAEPDDPWLAARKRAAANRATGSAADHQAGGRTSTSKDNFSALQNWLQMHKEYPPHLKKEKIQGTVVITFTFDREGNVLKAAVEKSSGNAELDRAALDMLAKAEPLPPIPDSMGRDTIPISIPVEYSLITR